MIVAEDILDGGYVVASDNGKVLSPFSYPTLQKAEEARQRAENTNIFDLFYLKLVLSIIILRG